MNKHDVLIQFEKLARTLTLDIGEISLYLLLLANCRDTSAGEIGCSSIKDAFGERYATMGELQRACRRLEEHGLIEILSATRDEINADNSIVIYRILSFKGKRVR